MAPQLTLILASASPRRREILESLGLQFRCRVPEIPEDARAGESPEAQVQRLALDKATAVAKDGPGDSVLAADTLVVLGEGEAAVVLGKPKDPRDAGEMLRRLSGREHRVLTGVALVCPGRSRIDMAATRVRFGELTRSQIDWYVGTREPMDKAGAYGIQGRAALFIREIHGSWSNVVGLPVERLPGLFRAVGDDLFHRI